MKIIIPVTEIENKNNVRVRGLHNAEYLCIYDCEERSYEWYLTEEISKKPGNLSIELRRKGIDTIISRDMPIMALGLFVESGFKILQAQSESVDENIDLFSKNELKPFTALTALMSTACTSSCSSCSSTTCN
jgi:predicted Fe-Mo cluster-binding NifX family protein